MNATLCHTVFERCILDYHVNDRVDTPMVQPYATGSVEALLYHKCWIDTVQWHLEDLVRDPQIEPVAGLALKRKIDVSNQQRTDMVEFIDSWLLDFYRSVQTLPDATFNTESPAWAIDRLSILALKVFHMKAEASREEADASHRNSCEQKCHVLLTQQTDLMAAIDQLLQDIASGKKYMKVYKQMKMYNDESLNPVLYQQKKN
ncbi:MAG: DUF4254 domain-containing protein [Chitinophagales bacterium]|nr:DUF4254 domain-containing protein [Chitinophagales bacterium]